MLIINRCIVVFSKTDPNGQAPARISDVWIEKDMSRKKIKRFAELETFPNFFRYFNIGKGGGWIRAFFGNDRPVTLELCCGKGDFSLGLAQLFPGRNVLGIDRKGDRLWSGASRSVELGNKNTAFLQTDIEILGELLDEGQVEEIWVTFPDPLPKRKQAKHRILGPAFLKIYRKLLLPGGLIHLKTDSEDFLDSTMEVLQGESVEIRFLKKDIYAEPVSDPLLQIKTDFERKHLAIERKIHYMAFSFKR